MTTDFKEELFYLAKFMGGSARTLHENLGKYDGIEEDEHRAYIWFEKSKAYFYVGNDDIVGWVSAPKMDADGYTYYGNRNYFTIDGLFQGMSKSEVAEKWGMADEEFGAVWVYHNRGGMTNSGQKFSLCVLFEEINSVYKLSGFEAKIQEIKKGQSIVGTNDKPKGACFIATACYGDYDSKEILILRSYRDNILLNSNYGKLAVRVYYFISPPFAKFIEQSDTLKTFIRKRLLGPIILKISKK